VGSRVSKSSGSIYTGDKLNDAIIDVRELAKNYAGHMVPPVNGPLCRSRCAENSICGYAILDFCQIIMDFRRQALWKLRNLAAERAIVFIGIASGKSALWHETGQM